jgi:hypothetical protein
MDAKVGFHGQHPRCLPPWFPVIGQRLIFHGKVFRESSLFCPSTIRSRKHRGSFIDRSSHFPHSACLIVYKTAGSVAKIAGHLVSRPGTGSGRDPAPRSPVTRVAMTIPASLALMAVRTGEVPAAGPRGSIQRCACRDFPPVRREGKGTGDRREWSGYAVFPPFWGEGVSIARSAPRGDSKTPRRVQTGVFSLKGTIG